MIDYKKIIKENNESIFPDKDRVFYSGKTVLVTGGGGSIGSALVKELAKLSADKIIIFDIYENNAYELYRALMSDRCVNSELIIEIGSVRDKERMDALFQKYKPEIVFHAAAHKHVILMEQNPCEALKNNCIGTYNCYQAAKRYGCERFILVSTDKAINPTGVMGASKRVCEMLVLNNSDGNIICSAVRFGNVFASHGSVIPLFEKQIEQGGPVTVTDRRASRYFISVQRAAQLLLCTGAMAENGETYILDMGEPYMIIDIAKKMIELSGKDIEIKEIGLLPGEKLFEEYLHSSWTRTSEKTSNDMVFVEKDPGTQPYSADAIIYKLTNILNRKESEMNADKVKELLSDIVPEYTPMI